MEKITSKNNPLITETAKLKINKYRKLTESFLMEGTKVLEAALASNAEITTIFFDEEKSKNFSELIAAAAKKRIKIFSVSEPVSQKLAAGKSTQGIFAVAKIEKHSVLDAEGGLIIALEDLSDPGNIGTIIRTADAAGVNTVVLSQGCADIYGDKVLRASMGSVFNLKLVVSDNFIGDLLALENKGYNLACGHLNGDDFFSRKKHDKNILIIGNEARGISKETKAMCQSLWKLPMRGGAESLNAAVAAGIMMYDIVRNG